MTTATPPSKLFQRIGILMQESLNFIGAAAAHHRERVAVKAVPRLSADKKRVVYVVRVRGELIPIELEHRLSGILFQARATLDRAMFAAATGDPSLSYSETEQRDVAFPIAESAEAWNKLLRKKHMSALGAKKVGQLRRIQPFVTGKPIATTLNDLHRFDKHRDPLELVVIADPQFPMLFDHVVDHPEGPGEWWIDFTQPNPPIADGLELVERRTLRPMISVGIEDVPLTCAAPLGGEFVDIQDLLWDAMEFVSRAAEILDGKDTRVADGMAAYIDAERTQLAAFHRGIYEDDWGEWLELAQPGKAPGDSFRRQ